jgi:hypothetical protein
MSSSLATQANLSQGTEAGECPDLTVLASALGSTDWVPSSFPCEPAPAFRDSLRDRDTSLASCNGKRIGS